MNMIHRFDSMVSLIKYVSLENFSPFLFILLRIWSEIFYLDVWGNRQKGKYTNNVLHRYIQYKRSFDFQNTYSFFLFQT